MVDITNLLTDQGTTASVTQSPTDTSFAAGYQSSVGGNDAILRKSLSEAEQYRAQEKRAALISQEADYQSKMSLPEGTEKLKQASMSALNTIAAIDETKRLAEVKKNESNYLTNSLLDIQQGYIDYVNNNPVPTDGKGYSQAVAGQINASLKDALDNAPTEQSKIELYQHATEMKMNAVNKAFDLETKQRETFRDTKINNQLSSIANNVYQDPASIDSFKGQVGLLAESLKIAGKDEAYVNQFIHNASGILVNQQVKGYLGLNTVAGFNAAEAVLKSSDAKNFITTSQYDTLVNSYGTERKAMIKELQKQQQKERASVLITHGMATKDTPGAIEAADDMFFNFMQSEVGNDIKNNPTKAVNSMADYIRKTGSVIGEQTQSYITSSVLNSLDPDTVGTTSQMIYQLAGDQTGFGSRFTAQLPSDVIKEASKVAVLINSGYAAADAVAVARKELRELSPVKKMELEGISKSLTEGQIDSILFKAYDGWGVDFTAAYGQGVKSYATEIFKTKWVEAGGDSEVATRLTMTALNKIGSITHVNGRKEFMIGAPVTGNDKIDTQIQNDVQDQLINLVSADGFEWRTYNSDVGNRKFVNTLPNPITIGLDKFRGVGRSIVGTAASGEMVELGIQPIDGVTVNQTDRKEYVVWDFLQNRPYISKDGSLKKVIVEQDKTKFGQIRQAKIAEYNASRELVNAQVSDMSNEIDKTTDSLLRGQ